MTIELSKTQTEALQSGAAHEEGHITLPATLRGGARQKVLTSLIGAKLAGYRSGTLVITPDGIAALGKSDVPSGRAAGYVLPEDEVVEQPDHFDTALGAVPDAAAAADIAEKEPAATMPNENGAPADDEPASIDPREEPTPAEDKPTKPMRTGTKQAQLIEMLKRPEGATVDEIVKALDWQAHTVRGAIAGALKKKLGLKVESEKEGERGRVYRIRG